MKIFRLLLTASLLASLGLASFACDKTNQEEMKEESEAMEKAKDKAGVEPSGTEAEAEDTPIEGTPEEIFGEMRREIDSYQDKVFSSSKDIPQDLQSKLDSISARIDRLSDELSIDELQAEEISGATEKQIAQIKKEWNQTKRQIDVALDTTEGEESDSENK